MSNPTATMDFFEHQDNARRRTGRLVFLFIFAVVLIVAAVYLAFTFSMSAIIAQQGHGIRQEFPLWDLKRFLIVAGITAGVITLGSMYKALSLSGGGGNIAKMLGGVRIMPDAIDPAQRRLLNIVEEMSIASGIPVPEVYLLPDENGINAFAAGTTTSNAAIAVTGGALKIFSRDELQ